MTYWQLLKKHPRSIGFGFINTFFSGLGQTHFVALYSGFIMGHFQLSSTQYGTLYSLITLASGFTISFIGPLIDKKDARWMALSVGLGLLLSQALVVSLWSLPLVTLGLFGLRLFGQGVSSSLASITVARFFTEQRGKALSLSQMGFPFYEGLITPLGAFLVTTWGLGALGSFLSLTLLFAFIPLSFFLTRDIPEFNRSTHLVSEKPESLKTQSGWNRKQVFQDKTIYFLLLQTLMPPFALTGVFFHQAVVAEQKGWSLALMASGLSFYALGRVINTFVTGPLVDRHGAKKLFPFYQLPLTLGFLIMGLTANPWTPALCFALFGLTVGSGGPIKSAIWAELYGVQHLGAIKSLFATIMIFSTAASPALFGWIIDESSSSDGLLIGLSILSLLASGLSYLGLQSFTKKPLRAEPSRQASLSES